MIPQDKRALISLKGLLCVVAGVFAVAAAFLIVLLTSAATVTGRAPASAVSLVDGLNTGILGPGEQRWFKFIPTQQTSARQVERSLTLFFTPVDGNRIKNVTFQLFEANQLPFYDRGDADQMTNFGAGQMVTRDHNPETGELFWTGWLFAGDIYYIQLENNKDIVIDYWLYTDDIYEAELELEATPTPVPEITGGVGPQSAIPLTIGLNKGGLDPGSEAWYSFEVADFDNEHFEEVALTMITTPDDGHRIQLMTFEIFTAEEVRMWSPGGNSRIDNLGAGSIVVRDANPLTGERFWDGWVVENQRYYVQIHNSADVHMDYWLFTGDVYGPELGQEFDSVIQHK